MSINCTLKILAKHFPESREFVESGSVKSKILLISETDYKRGESLRI